MKYDGLSGEPIELLARSLGIFVILCATVAPANSQTAGNPPTPLPAGQSIDNVACTSDPTESYALYLPSTYTPAKRWPIIYAFDPFARGRVPVKLYKDLAEKYGYILAGSNNSRNFSLAESSKAANAMWQDTHLRLALDESRIYTTGFSGGARIAGLLALGCAPCRIAGVIAFGAGYPNLGKPAPKDSLDYFLGVGDEDFNWPEVVGIRRQREDDGLPCRVRVFPGPHQWGPPPVMEEAIEWMRLKAMQAGAIPPDGVFLDRLFQKLQAEAREAAQHGDPIAQLSAERTLVSDFSGLKEVSEETKKLTALKQSAALKAALKREEDSITEQTSLIQDASAKLARLDDASVDERLTLRTDILDGMTGLKQQAGRSRNDERRRLLLRAFNSLWVQGLESGQAQFEQKHWDKAESYFQLISQVSPDDPWPPLLLAETRTAMGDKKQAIKDLKEAIRRGLKNPEAVEKDAKLQALQSEAEYRKIVEEMKGK